VKLRSKLEKERKFKEIQVLELADRSYLPYFTVGRFSLEGLSSARAMTNLAANRVSEYRNGRWDSPHIQGAAHWYCTEKQIQLRGSVHSSVLSNMPASTRVGC